jgi:hypothetical protein
MWCPENCDKNFYVKIICIQNESCDLAKYFRFAVNELINHSKAGMVGNFKRAYKFCMQLWVC